MESDPLDECRCLIRHHNQETFSQRCSRNGFRLPSRKFLGFGMLLSLLISLILILVMQVYSSNNDLNEDSTDFVEEDDEILYFNGTDERELFLNEWKRNEEILQDERLRLLHLYDKVLSKNVSPHDDMELHFSESEQKPVKMLDCELVLENMKKKFKKCISVDILPEACLSLLRNNIECDAAYPYRLINGTCNNLINPTWGKSGAPYLRLLKADYDDGVSELRKSIYGVDLPNTRLLSSKIYDDKSLPDAETTMMFMNYGLLLDHDMINSLLPAKDVKIHCCEPEVKADPRLRHTSCEEVEVPSTDPFYIERNITCLNFYRSVPAIGKCPGRREQSNLMTAYIDLSVMYGPTEQESTKLRKFEGGKLLHSLIGDTPVLPINNNSGNLCYTRDAKYQCFSSGDVRVNMQVEIMVLHTIWMREHNRLAEELQILNPRWNDEKVFQEARRINIAQFQHITYNEFLPCIFGKKRMKLYGLDINTDEIYDGYDETVETGIYNAFSSAVFRFGHTLIQSVWEFRGPDYKVRSRIPLRNIYTNPTIIYKHGLDDIIRGMLAQRTYHPERHTTREVRNRLLQRYYSDYGLDLSMITIHRGRDRGLPPYTKWRKFCGLEEINSWDDMYKIMDKKRADELREMYMSVHDVDLATGGLSEYHLEGSLLGPTYICIMRKQFQNLRESDRFWYENRNQAGSFTPSQLSEIYKRSFARILCDTSDDLRKVQLHPFRIKSNDNPMVECDELPKMDLSHWAENRKF